MHEERIKEKEYESKGVGHFGEGNMAS